MVATPFFAENRFVISAYRMAGASNGNLLPLGGGGTGQDQAWVHVVFAEINVAVITVI